jgi:thioredoxin-related protein
VDPFAEEAIPAALRGGGSRFDPASDLAELQNDAGTVMDPTEIVYTDPDAEDPEAAVAELRDLLETRPEEGPWDPSITRVARRARQEGQPVLIWFTDSGNPMAHGPISRGLFGRQDFEEWAAETFIRMRVDAEVGSEIDHEGAVKADYVEDLKKRYEVLGYPTLVVLTPAGEVIAKYRGFAKDQWEYKWGQLRQAAFLANEAHARWTKKMQEKGYRTWSDPSGRKFFAKLVAYRDGELILVEPDGARARTHERQLSQADRDWIAAEKRKRGLD